MAEREREKGERDSKISHVQLQRGEEANPTSPRPTDVFSSRGYLPARMAKLADARDLKNRAESHHLAGNSFLSNT
jgi:hypothetical protein